MSAVIGRMAPEIQISEWVQGMPTTLAQERDKIVLLEVFQVNCPGCFLYGIPEAIQIYTKYRDEGVRVLGVATAFEDFDKNTLENLRALAESGEVVGETLRALHQYGKIDDNTLPYKIPFPLGADMLVRTSGQIDDSKVVSFIKTQYPEFDSITAEKRAQMIQHVRKYMLSKEYSAQTFETYGMQGTPSTILIDRNGILRDMTFGQTGTVESKIQALLRN